MDVNLLLLKMRVAPRSICLLHCLPQCTTRRWRLHRSSATRVVARDCQMDLLVRSSTRMEAREIGRNMTCGLCLTGQGCCALFETFCKQSERYCRLARRFQMIALLWFIPITVSRVKHTIIYDKRWIKQTPLLRRDFRGRVDAWCWELSRKTWGEAVLKSIPLLDRAATGRSCAPGSSQRERNPLILLSGLRSLIWNLAKMGWGKAARQVHFLNWPSWWTSEIIETCKE